MESKIQFKTRSLCQDLIYWEETQCWPRRSEVRVLGHRSCRMLTNRRRNKVSMTHIMTDDNNLSTGQERQSEDAYISGWSIDSYWQVLIRSDLAFIKVGDHCYWLSCHVQLYSSAGWRPSTACHHAAVRIIYPIQLHRLTYSNRAGPLVG